MDPAWTPLSRPRLEAPLSTLFVATALLTVLSLSFDSSAEAQERWLLTAELDGAMALSAPQSELFGPGGGASVALYRSLSPLALIGVRLGATVLSDGPPPLDATHYDPGLGGGVTLAVALRLRAPGAAGNPRRSTGPFLELVAGGAVTGPWLRPSIEAGVGWGFDVGSMTVAPVVRYQQLIHLDDQLDTRDARTLLVGFEFSFFDGRPATASQVAPTAASEPSEEGDRDGDGILDAADACPFEPEDEDGFEDEDGCPELDNDHDGIADAEDGCPLRPEDEDGFEDEDGCPELDNDHDGIVDTEDACPMQPEVVNGVDDEDGCPDEGVLEMRDDRIILEERVLFDFERARVKHAARPILAAIVRLAAQQGNWERVRVEGHADERGDEGYNLRLSQLRAERVKRVLVALGFDEAMIETEGFGSARPRVQHPGESGHQQNRRVEFVVLARRQPAQPTEAAAPAVRASDPDSDSSTSEEEQP